MSIEEKAKRVIEEQLEELCNIVSRARQDKDVNVADERLQRWKKRTIKRLSGKFQPDEVENVKKAYDDYIRTDDSRSFLHEADTYRALLLVLQEELDKHPEEVLSVPIEADISPPLVEVPQLFLSYAREDEERVESLYQKLSDAGFKPWMDKRDILPGEKWKSCIQKAIRWSDFFLACLSANSVSKRGYLQKEIREALDIWQEMLEDDIYLIPVRLEDCEVPERLREFQWVNLFEENGWTWLVEAIREGTKRRAQVSADEGPSPDMEMTIPEEGPEQVRSKPMAIRFRGSLIQKIGFDYFPEESPIRNGWAVEGTLPEFTLADYFGEKALAIQQVGWYALDYEVEPGARFGEFVEFVAKFKAGAAVYAHIDVQSKNYSKSERGWIKFQIGTSQPQPVPHNEWVLYVTPTELDGNWQMFHTDLIDAVNRTFGNDGWSFEQLIGFRLRGNLELAYISVFESHEKTSLDMEMAKPEEGPDQVQKLSVNKSSSAQTPIIRSVLLSTDAITDGGSITVTVSVQSDAPVNWLNRSLDGPNGNIYGGGSGQAFTEISSGIWETQWTDKISKWYPSGIYTYKNISVRNESLLTSAPWPPLTFTVNNSN